MPPVIKEESPKKQGLRRSQLKILTTLASCSGMTREALAIAALGFKDGMVDSLGAATGKASRDWGYPSLLHLGAVRFETFDIDGKKEQWYEITETGRNLLAKAQNEEVSRLQSIAEKS